MKLRFTRNLFLLFLLTDLNRVFAQLPCNNYPGPDPFFLQSTLDFSNLQPGQYCIPNFQWHEFLDYPFHLEYGRCMIKPLHDSLIGMINHHPEFLFKVRIHTACGRDSLSDLTLSQHQADTLMGRLRPLLKYANLVAEGCGSALPLKGCSCSGRSTACREEDLQKNRRTELIIVSKRTIKR